MCFHVLKILITACYGIYRNELPMHGINLSLTLVNQKKILELKKRWIILISIAVILIGLRIALPFILENVINDKLDNLEDYTGRVEDVDLRLFRGAYTIDTVTVQKRTDTVPVPFFAADRIELSLQWDALFDGAIVGSITAFYPRLNFTVSSSGGEEITQTGENVDWYEEVKGLLPLRINRIEIIQGQITYKDYTTQPMVDVSVDSLDMIVKNLTNVIDAQKKLPASLKGTGIVAKSGSFDVEAQMDILQEVPDLDLNLKIENVALPSLNDYLKAFTNTDARDGKFSLYTEIILNDGNIEGYVKPVLENIDLIKWNKEEEPFIDKVWESIVGGVAELFENQPKDRLATEVPLSGNIEDLDAGIGVTLWNVVKNAFIEALNKELNNSLDYENSEN